MNRFIPRSIAALVASTVVVLTLAPVAGAADEPFIVTTPGHVIGGVHTFTGSGEPGATVEWLSGLDGFIPCATVAVDGTWSCDIPVPDVPQNTTPTEIGTISFALAGNSVPVPLFAAPVAAPSLTGVPGDSLMDSAAWGGGAYRVPVEGVSFAPSGSAEPGASITVAVGETDGVGVGTYGAPICSTTADGDGAWECPEALVTVPALAGSPLRFTGVQLTQTIPGYLDRGTDAYTVQATFSVTDPEDAVHIPFGGATAGTFAGTGAPGATVSTGLGYCATVDGDGLWSCVVDAGRMSPGVYPIVLTATVPHPSLGMPLTIGQETRNVVFDGAGDPPIVPDSPTLTLAVPCVGTTSLRVLAGEAGEDGLSDGCSCPAGARFGDGLTPDPLVGAMVSIRDGLGADALAVLATRVADHADPARGWRGQMEAFITWSGQVFAPEPGEMPEGADSAWADGLDVFTYTPDWWKVAQGHVAGCVTDPAPPAEEAPPVAPASPPELAETGTSTSVLLFLGILLTAAGVGLMLAGSAVVSDALRDDEGEGR